MSSKVLFNNSGVPLIGFGTRGVFINTKGAPAEKPKKLAQPQNDDPDKTTVDKIEISDWGTGNMFPTTADALINSVSVLNSGLNLPETLPSGRAFSR